MQQTQPNKMFQNETKEQTITPDTRTNYLGYIGMPAYQHMTPPGRSSLNINNSFEGETIEQRVAKILNNNEPIKDGAPQIYTERKDGVIPEYNIRTDRFDQAIEMTTIMSQREITKRLERQNTLNTPPEPQKTTPSPTPDITPKPSGETPT